MRTYCAYCVPMHVPMFIKDTGYTSDADCSAYALIRAATILNWI